MKTRKDKEDALMKKTVLTVFLFLLPLAALILEVLPYGAVLVFGTQGAGGEIEAIRTLTSYFDPLLIGYANFGPPLAFFLTCALLLCGIALLFKTEACLALSVIAVFAFTASILPLIYGISYLSVLGIAVSLLLGAEAVLAHIMWRAHVKAAAKTDN